MLIHEILILEKQKSIKYNNPIKGSVGVIMNIQSI